MSRDYRTMRAPGPAPRVRALALACVAVFLAGATVACVTRSLAEAPPQGIDLSGDWQLNTALSDDARKMLNDRLAKMNERLKRRMPRAVTARAAPALDANAGTEPPRGARPPRPYYQERLAGMVKAPERMQISLNGVRFVVKHDSTYDEYRAGGRSVVSFGRGVADRTAGWRGPSFIVSTKGVDGTLKEDRYSLDADGRLMLVTTLRSEGLQELVIRRIYERAGI